MERKKILANSNIYMWYSPLNDNKMWNVDHMNFHHYLLSDPPLNY